MPQASCEIPSLIRHEIQTKGPLSFARFMELALYHPAHGYYQRPRLEQIGCQGDYFTSVSVGPLFGRLLAFQFSEWLDALETASPAPTEPFHLVEAGAHDGSLAADVLAWFHEHRPDLVPRLRYAILEPSELRRQHQAARLAPFASATSWFHKWTQVPLSSLRGIIFSNELLDAFPIYRLGWDAPRQAWFEWRVAVAHEQFAWTRTYGDVSPEVRRELMRPVWQSLPPELLAVLPDGFTVEFSPLAEAWWEEAALRLSRGKLLTSDYGLEREEFFLPHRSQGTLRSYCKHRLTDDPLGAPGQQDLTAHVNFSALREAGERAGLLTEFWGSQANFLTRVAAEVSQHERGFGAWTREDTRQFQTLTHPNHLGATFRVLVQRQDGQGRVGTASSGGAEADDKG